MTRENVMETVTLSAHYDGLQIQLDDPYELQPNTKLLVTVIQVTEPDDIAWRNFSSQGLEAAYSIVEPEYSLNLIKELNHSYEGR